MLDRMAEKGRQQEIFSREDTPTEQQVLASFLYHTGLSFRNLEPFVDCGSEAIGDWFHRCKHLFEPDCRDRQEVAVDETTIEIDGDEHYVWAAVDCDTLEGGAGRLVILSAKAITGDALSIGVRTSCLRHDPRDRF